MAGLTRYNVASLFQGAFTARRVRTELIVVHHAAALYRQPTGLDDVREVARYHTRTKGWGGIGYHECIAEVVNGGAVARYKVSDWELQRAHIWGLNHRAFGVSCLTNFTGLPDQKWIDALVEVLVEAKRRWPKAQIVGHTDAALPGYGTTCPGPRWHDWKPGLLARVEAALGPANPKPGWYRVRQDTAAYESRSRSAPIAWNGSARLWLGQELNIDDITDGWAHWPAAGFVPLSDLEAI